MSDNFVEPIPTRLTLPDGQFIDVKQRLTHGETEDMYDLIYPRGEMSRKWVRTAKIDAYLLSWSLTRQGVPVPMSPELDPQSRLDTIRALDPDRAFEIYAAIDAHELKMAQTRAAQKKILAGSPNDAATSPSPSGLAGASAPEPSAPSTSTTTPGSSSS